MDHQKKSPAELRSMFGANLRELSRSYPSVSELSRRLGINRTQFNRYLAGESFPRPDVLARICDFFGVDARVLLEPVDALGATQSALDGPELGAFLGVAMTPDPAEFPSGFYRFSRRSFLSPDKYVVSVVRVWRNAARACFMRGFETREAMRQQALPMRSDLREFRGSVMRLENGIGILVSRKQALTVSFNYLHPVSSFENNFWSGYVARTIPENVEADRVTRMIYEYIGTAMTDVLPAARRSGLVTREDLSEFKQRLLQPDARFR